jgi:hypothetical protein
VPVETGAWLQVRCTAPGVLESLGYDAAEPPPGSEAHDRIFSIVIDEGGGRTRTLPMLYHGPAQIYADRRLENLGLRLDRALEAIAAAETEAVYMATACRIGDTYGIYMRDLFNRASFRLHMARLGVEFAHDPYTKLVPSGRFECRDWGEFDPEFLVSGGPFPRDPEEVEVKRGAMAPFMFGVFRLGRITPPELVHLGRFVRNARVLASQSPHAVVTAVQAA